MNKEQVAMLIEGLHLANGENHYTFTKGKLTYKRDGEEGSDNYNVVKERDNWYLVTTYGKFPKSQISTTLLLETGEEFNL